MKAAVGLVWLAAALASGGCSPEPLAFTCTEDAQCVFRGRQGMCERSGACSFPDESCPGGRRHGVHAPADLTGTCVAARLCGDGEVSPGEECDDGNENNADGCTNRCVRCGRDQGDARQAWDVSGACYVRHDTALPWPAASAACEAAGGHLLALATNTEIETLRPRLLAGITAPIWIGLSDRAVEGTFAWVTGEPLVRTSWSAGQPDGRTPTLDCVATQPAPTSGEAWSTRECATPLGYVCERPPWTVRTTDRHAYRLLYAAGPWDEASQACRALGGHLATITSEEEQAFVIANFFGDFWLGGRRVAGALRWITDEPFAYQAFAATEPDNWGGMQDCIHMAPVRRWHDAPCTVNKTALCEID